MPYPIGLSLHLSENQLIIDELSYDMSALETEHSHLIDKLTRKTFLWNTLSTALRSKGEIVVNVASSGIADLLFPGGRTAHSRFCIPINPTDESFCHILPNSNLADLVRKAKLVIWDEAPMVKKICVETLDRTLRDICRSTDPNSMEKPFGGKVIVFGGDFRQILPVITKGKRKDIVAYLLVHVTGNGEVNPTEDGIFEIEMSEYVLVNDVEDPIGSIISSVYPDYLNNLGNPTYYQQRAILAPTNEIVDIINNRMMESLDGEAKSFLSSDSICRSERDSHFNSELYTTDYLNSINLGGLP
ncbi:uncharacterized protein [Rutidosis leptorrhynchoides]|uniref:uncharacterized protein n=1 Tax=Rutidosis leptorrhynchoides TaxID=125765 RepID=UPI003A996F15